MKRAATVELEIKLDQACLALKLALSNQQHVQNVKEAWIKMSMTSTQKRSKGGRKC